MKKIAALVFSDLHLNVWSKFNQDLARTRVGFDILFQLAKEGKELGVPGIFCGDLFHKAESVDFDLLKLWHSEINKLDWEILYIDGNHDLKYQNRIGNPQESLISLLCWPHIPTYAVFRPINLTSWKHYSFPIVFWGIPYIDDNEGVNEYLKKIIEQLDSKNKNILVIHTTLTGAKDTDGREVETSNSPNPNLLGKFDLVLCGHIHCAQRLSKKVFIVGATNQQRRTDRNCEMGYWKLYSDLTMEFCPIKGCPKFIDVENTEQIQEDGNYYTVIPKTSSEIKQTNHKITKQLSKKALVRKYMRAKGIKDKPKKNLLINILNKTE